MSDVVSGDVAVLHGRAVVRQTRVAAQVVAVGVLFAFGAGSVRHIQVVTLTPRGMPYHHIDVIQGLLAQHREEANELP